MTTTLPPQLESQSSPGDRMNNPPAESGSPQRDLELLQLVQEIQASEARKASLAIQANKDKDRKASQGIKGWPKEAVEQNKVFRKQIDRFTREILDRLKPEQQRLIGKWSGIVDIESIVAEAVSNAYFEAVRNIDKYDPDRGDVMKWIKGILNYRLLDLLRKYRERYESVSIDNTAKIVETKIAKIIEKISDPEPESSGSKLLQFIEEDPDGHLNKDHIKGKPAATFKAILLMRANNSTWQDIADRFDISTHSTVSSFVKRRSKDWEDYFNEHLYS